MNGTIDPQTNYVNLLGQRLGREWPAIAAAQRSALEVRAILGQALDDDDNPFSSGDVDIVVFGSLARGEWTSGSDVDWTLLVDCQVDPVHRVTARAVGERIGETVFRGNALPRPGAEGIFGKMAFSHEIVHHIGGEADTNRNTTQRVLLLLEAAPIHRTKRLGDTGPYERVLNQILYRYLHDDSNFAAESGTESKIPRFLLNDIVRYWRTMCVDFAYKQWDRGDGRWALRNLKLRLSRKLLFVSGLLTVFSCYRNDALSGEVLPATEHLNRLQEHLLQYSYSSALNIVVQSLQQLELAQHAGRLLDHYDQFLAEIDNSEVRKHLAALPAKDAYNDAQFLKVRALSHEFQRVLTELFFLVDSDLRDFTQEYGVF